ncbi:retrotransposon protein, putative, ty1-copia subclass [Tanacetum coccineum]
MTPATTARSNLALPVLQGFREARKLKQRALYLYVGNDVRAQVEAIGSYDVVFPNGLVICLDNCHYAPSITRGVVSVHRLVENGFVQRFTDFEISVSKNNVFYFNAIPSNGIYEIDMHDLVPNVNSIYNVSTKRAKHNLDFTYLWHCRLAHISKKRIERLQQEGILKSTDDESFDQCVSCLSGKMTRKSFPHCLERATDLLGIIHTDITPPYTPQHNGVSEKKNRTLLDMVRSMMNLTTLSLSFWDYALESATRILNMVPTKKGCEALVKRDTLDKLQQRSIKCIFIGYPKETISYYFYFPPENKIVVVRYAEFFEKNLITQEVSGRAMDLEEIQDEDTSPSKITSEIPMEVLVDLPPGCKTVRSKLIFKKKTDMDGIVHTYKARLVAKDYTQLYRVDYEETFSPVADIRAIRILISIAAFYDYGIWQMDVKTAFLNGYLDEDIYMVQPEGFVDPNHPIKVSGSNVTFLILYVDDIIIMGNHILSLQSVKDYLGKCFAMKDLGEATFILGIKIYRDMSKRLIGLGQNAYMDKILKRHYKKMRLMHHFRSNTFEDCCLIEFNNNKATF